LVFVPEYKWRLPNHLHHHSSSMARSR
jgi:hypothetical protein